MKFLSTILGMWLSVMAFAQEANPDFDLRECLLYAIEKSPAKTKFLFSRQRAEANWRLQKSKNLPQINAYADYSHFFELPTYIFPAREGSVLSSGDSDGPYAVQLGRPDNLFAGARLSQVLFDKRWLSTNDFQSLDNQINRISEQLVEEDIIETVSVAFIELQKYSSKMDALEASMIRLTGLRDLMVLQSENDVITSTEIDRLDLKISRLEIEKSRLSGAIKAQLGKLKFHMGMPLDTELTLNNNGDNLDQALLTPDGGVPLKVDLLDKQEKLGELTSDAVNDSYFPQVRAFADFQLQAQRNSVNFISDAKWYPRHVVGVGVNVPIFTGFEKKVKVQQEEIKVDEARFNKELAESESKLQLDFARDQMETAGLIVENTQVQKTLANSLLDKVTLQFREGVATYRDVTIAEQEAADANNQYEEAIFDYKLAQIKYLKASDKLRGLLQ